MVIEHKVCVFRFSPQLFLPETAVILRRINLLNNTCYGARTVKFFAIKFSPFSGY